MLHTLAALALTAALPLVQEDRPPFARQELGAEARAALVERFRVTEGLGWGAQAPDVIRRASALDPERLDAEVARAEVRLRTTRDFELELAWLDALRLVAAAVGSGRPRIGTLVALARARSRALGELGRYDEALAATWALLPDEAAILRTEPVRAVTRPLEPREREVVLAALDDPALVAARAALAAARDGAAGGALLPGFEGLAADRARFLAEAFGSPGPEITRVVRESLAAGESGTIRGTLGMRAAPSLAWLALSLPDESDPRWLDPLEELAAIDPRGAARLIAAYAAEQSSAWRRRALEVLGDARLFAEGYWRYTSDPEIRAGRPNVPEWLDVLAALFADAQLRPATLGRLEFLTRVDGLDDRLRGELARAVRAADASGAAALLQVLDVEWRVPSAQPLYAELLADGRPAVRRAAAARLARFEPVPALLAVAGDPDPELRRALARAFASRQELVRRGNGTTWLRVRPAPTPERVAAWERLLTDPDPGVRELAVEALASNPAAPASLFAAGLASPDPATRAGVVQALANETAERPVDEEQLAALCDQALADPAPAVRAALAGVTLPGLQLQRVVLPQLALDPAGEVLARVDEQLEGPWWQRATGEAVAAALEARTRNVARPFEPHGGGQAGWKELCERRIGASRAEVLTLLELGLGRAPRAVLDCALDKVIRVGVNEANQGNAYADWLLELEPGDLAALFCWAFESASSNHRRLIEALLDPPGAAAQAATRALFVDSDRELEARLRAASHTGALWSEEAEEALFGLLRAPGWERVTDRAGKVASLPAGGERTNAIVLRVLAEDALLEPVRYEASRRYFDPRAAGADAAAWALVERWLGSGWDVSLALDHLAQTGDPKLVPLLIEAAHDPRTMMAAIRGMELHGAPEFVDALGRCLTLRALIGDPDQSSIQIAAARALVRYGTPEAAEFLRQGLLNATPASRQELTFAQAVLRTHLSSGADAAPTLGTRDEAARELVALLSSPSATARAEAARGLASLGALEALPRLIPLLDDEDADVRSAARQALDRLNAATPPRPAAEGD